MLRRLWRNNRTLILVSLAIYGIVMAILVIGSCHASDVPFDYQIR
jgi:hypothetical protein